MTESIKRTQEKLNEQITSISASLSIVYKEIDHIKAKKDLTKWDSNRLYMAYRAKEIGERLLNELTGN